MAIFRKTQTPEQQAKSIARSLQLSHQIHSVRTLSNYQERLEQIAKNMPLYGITGEIRAMSIDDAHRYLEIRAGEVGQKTLDMERQAIQAIFKQMGKLDDTSRLTVVKSEHKQILTGRSYTKEQVAIISSHQSDRYSLATQIAYHAGLRAHELLTLEHRSRARADRRPAHNEKFRGRGGERYIVTGKGGLKREVLIPFNLAEQLEKYKLTEAQKIKDRNVFYQQNYDIPGGKNFSNVFSSTSKRHLNWSTGAHGLRHSYAQERMRELQQTLTRDFALEVVSQEMGHFRAEITEVYLR